MNLHTNLNVMMATETQHTRVKKIQNLLQGTIVAICQRLVPFASQIRINTLVTIDADACQYCKLSIEETVLKANGLDGCRPRDSDGYDESHEALSDQVKVRKNLADGIGSGSSLVSGSSKLSASQTSLVNQLVGEALKLWYDEGSSPGGNGSNTWPHRARTRSLEANGSMKELGQGNVLERRQSSPLKQDKKHLMEEMKQTLQKNGGSKCTDSNCNSDDVQQSNRVYECKLCHKRFSYRTNLTRHQRKIHGRGFTRRTQEEIARQKQQTVSEWDLFSQKEKETNSVIETTQAETTEAGSGVVAMESDSEDNDDNNDGPGIHIHSNQITDHHQQDQSEEMPHQGLPDEPYTLQQCETAPKVQGPSKIPPTRQDFIIADGEITAEQPSLPVEDRSSGHLPELPSSCTTMPNIGNGSSLIESLDSLHFSTSSLSGFAETQNSHQRSGDIPPLTLQQHSDCNSLQYSSCYNDSTADLSSYQGDPVSVNPTVTLSGSCTAVPVPQQQSMQSSTSNNLTTLVPLAVSHKNHAPPAEVTSHRELPEVGDISDNLHVGLSLPLHPVNTTVNATALTQRHTDTDVAGGHQKQPKHGSKKGKESHSATKLSVLYNSKPYMKLTEVASEGHPYKCPLCDRSFPFYQNLGRHAKLSHGMSVVEMEKGAVLPPPEQPVAQSSSSSHKRHKCTVCGHAFSFRSNLSRHRKVLHGHGASVDTSVPRGSPAKAKTKAKKGKKKSKVPGSNPENGRHSKGRHKCAICECSFSFSANLSRHIRKVHKLVRADLYRAASLESQEKSQSNTRPRPAADATGPSLQTDPAREWDPGSAAWNLDTRMVGDTGLGVSTEMPRTRSRFSVPDLLGPVTGSTSHADEHHRTIGLPPSHPGSHLPAIPPSSMCPSLPTPTLPGPPVAVVSPQCPPTTSARQISGSQLQLQPALAPLYHRDENLSPNRQEPSTQTGTSTQDAVPPSTKRRSAAGSRAPRSTEKARYRHVCDTCGQAFTFRTNLTRHVKHVHGTVPV